MVSKVSSRKKSWFLELYSHKTLSDYTIFLLVYHEAFEQDDEQPVAIHLLETAYVSSGANPVIKINNVNNATVNFNNSFFIMNLHKFK